MNEEKINKNVQQRIKELLNKDIIINEKRTKQDHIDKISYIKNNLALDSVELDNFLRYYSNEFPYNLLYENYNIEIKVFYTIRDRIELYEDNYEIKDFYTQLINSTILLKYILDTDISYFAMMIKCEDGTYSIDKYKFNLIWDFIDVLNQAEDYPYHKVLYFYIKFLLYFFNSQNRVNNISSLNNHIEDCKKVRSHKKNQNKIRVNYNDYFNFKSSKNYISKSLINYTNIYDFIQGFNSKRIASNVVLIRINDEFILEDLLHSIPYIFSYRIIKNINKKYKELVVNILEKNLKLNYFQRILRKDTLKLYDKMLII